jgi:hypothetical protein
MGLDFIRRAAPTFTKGWDRGKTDLSNPTLFTRYPECRTRTTVAHLDDSAEAQASEHVAVCVRGSGLILVRETTQIGHIDSVPPDLFRAIDAAGGCALGLLVRINPLSGTADVEIE